MDGGRRSILAALIVVLLTSVALAGCGGSSSAGSGDTTTTSETTTTTETTTETTAVAPTHQEFVAALDSICKRGSEAVTDLQEQWGDALEAGDFARAAGLFKQLQRKVVPFRAELAELVAPPSDEAAFARFKAATNTQFDSLVRIDSLVDRMIPALEASDLTKFKRLVLTVATSARKARKAALDLGTEHCGR
jgi:hypothetical protein